MQKIGGKCTCILEQYINECATYNFCRECGCPGSDEEFYDPVELIEKKALEEEIIMKQQRRKIDENIKG